MDLGIVWIVPISGLIAIFFALSLVWNVLRRDAGTKKMQEIGGTILEGAMAFLKRQYTTIGILAVVTALIIGAIVGLLRGAEGIEGMTPFGIAWHTAVAFIVGAFCSGISGFIGMYISVKSNVRCASAARKNLNEAIQVALYGGSVSGFLIVALSLLGVAIMFYIFGGYERPDIAPHLIVGFGFGASFVALFAQRYRNIFPKQCNCRY